MPVEIEPLAPGRVRITFSFRGEAESVAVEGAVQSLGDTRMTRAGAEWTLSLEAPSNLRTVYWFSLDGEKDWARWLPDPGNPSRYVYPSGLEFTGDAEVVGSMLELPDAPPDRWSLERRVPHGEVSLDVLDGRRVWRYRPVQDPEALLLLFDGHAYTTLAPAPFVLDNLIAEGLIPPVAAVLPDSLDTATRMRELGRDPGFLGWACDRLLPWSGFAAPPERTVVAGSSMGGLAAIYFAQSRQDIFGNVLAQSPALFGELPPLPVGLDLRWYLDAGVLEAELLPAVRSFHAELGARGYGVTYREFPGGHDFFWWRETLADGLLALLGRARREPR